MGSRPSSSTIAASSSSVRPSWRWRGFGGGHRRSSHRSRNGSFPERLRTRVLESARYRTRRLIPDVKTGRAHGDNAGFDRESRHGRRPGGADPHHDRAAQGGVRRRPVRGSGGQELPRSTRAEPAPAGPRRTPDSIKKRLAAIDTQLRDASALHQLQLVQERWTSSKELEPMLGAKVDLSALEAAFVKTAAKYARAQGHLLRGVARAGRARRRAQEGRDHASFLSCTLPRRSPAAADARRERSSTTPSALTEERRRWRARGAA